MKAKITKTVESLDLFGCKFRLNFKEHEDTVNTFPGGVCSIIIWATILSQTYSLISGMILFQND